MNFRPIVSAVALAALLLVRPATAGLPTSPSTTYVPNSTPAIKAQDLNDLQKYLAGLYSALFSVKALVVDGTGGNAAGATPGTVRVSSTVSAYTTTPPFAMPTVPVGQLSREHVILGSVRCLIPLGSGAISQCGGVNVYSVVRTAAGLFTVTFNNAFPDVNRHVPQLTVELEAGVFNVGAVSNGVITGGRFSVSLIIIKLPMGSLNDPTGFDLTVVGG